MRLSDLVLSTSRESQVILVTGARRTGKTTKAAELAVEWLRRASPACKLFVVDPDEQLRPLQAVGAQFVDLGQVADDNMPVWLPPPVSPWRETGLVVIDEAADQVRDPGREALRRTILRCGPRGLHVVLTTQRPADLGSVCGSATRQVDWLVSGFLSAESDYQYIRETLGVDASPCRYLPRHRFLAWRVSPV